MLRRFPGSGAVLWPKGKQPRPPEWGCRLRRLSATRREISIRISENATAKVACPLRAVAAALCRRVSGRPDIAGRLQQESVERAQFAQAFHFFRSGFT